MKKRLLSFLVAFVVVPASVAGVLYHLNGSGFFNLDNINIVVENADQQAQYLKPLILQLDQQLEKYRGQSLWRLDLKKISRETTSVFWVSSSYLSRGWPSKLTVKVTPKEVKLLYLSKGGEMLPMVDEGQFLPPVAAKQIPDVAILEGEIFEKNLEMRKKAVKVISEIPTSGKFSQKNISELRFDPKEGFWATLIQSGIRVKLGEDQVVTKSARVSQVLEYVENRQLEARVIDANLSKKVLVRLRKGP